jgi:hypothetical protein
MSKECESCGQELPNDIWKDPMVCEALKDGRSVNDIMVIACPECNRYGYYNEGSHFSCRFCNETFHVTDSDEFEPVTLVDTITETTEGYHNETMPHSSTDDSPSASSTSKSGQ